jgi:hypothetical protein
MSAGANRRCPDADATLAAAAVNVRIWHRETSAVGREYALATGRFREAEFQWPLSGDQFEERIDATR